MNLEPRLSASFNISIMRLTTLARLSARWIGPSWAEETFRRRDTVNFLSVILSEAKDLSLRIDTV